eukprot:Opistho-2@40588
MKTSEVDGRTRETLRSMNPYLGDQIIPAHDGGTVDEARAAVILQSTYRGLLARRKYVDLLFAKYESEEAARQRNEMRRLEEGEVLLETVHLKRMLSETSVVERSKHMRETYAAVVVQRAFRKYLERRRGWHKKADPESPQVNGNGKGAGKKKGKKKKTKRKPQQQQQQQQQHQQQQQSQLQQLPGGTEGVVGESENNAAATDIAVTPNDGDNDSDDAVNADALGPCGPAPIVLTN